MPTPLAAALVVSGALLLGGCSASKGVPDSAGAPASSEEREQELHLAGCFESIWNGETKFMLVDDQGRWTRLLIEPDLMGSLGGSLALNGRRVKISGKAIDDSVSAVRVSSIELESDGEVSCGG